MKFKGHYRKSLCLDTTNKQVESNNPTIRQKLLTAPEREAIVTVAVVEVNGITCRALLNNGGRRLHISSTLTLELKKPPIRTDYKQIETILNRTNTLIDIYDVKIKNAKGGFTMNTEVSKVDRTELISMPNPHYEDIVQTNTHLQGVQMEDSDNKVFTGTY